MGAVVYLDTILVPLGVFLTIGYHAYLCYTIKNKPSLTTFGTNQMRRTAWFLNFNQQVDDKKAMLGVQSLRNTLIGSIMTASIAILVNLALAALTNNSYNASHHLLSSGFFGSKSDTIFILKYGSASLLLVVSFLCSSMGVGYLIDANFLMNECDELLTLGYTQTILERGFSLAHIGSRMLYLTVPLLLWMLGPLPLLLSSLALLWVLRQLDFVNLKDCNIA